ncbi:TonB-dependent receptor plug domain-containing protein [Arundinibacter roseus]|uniref:TonB-dependent receptor n=1 Tax=Arundinibacter roseus TaxID=2070510 RepID=A0A4R4K7U0_9BACT|nr:TonB-dependent receptor [Arundinibacter roseus]TDB63714.1 TonB-dependent receptor [Arundinibacter roseus]
MQQSFRKNRKVAVLGFCILLFQLTESRSQSPSADPMREDSLAEMVVTATRSERQLGALPMPVSVISKKQIQAMGSLRLNDVLAEQTGLFMVNDHGNGVQVQGFNPDYTLILVDGEPLIGRTAGTLELSRISVGNIKQIEIVKGPSSSLYGSEALAGVINIITENPNRTFAEGNLRYGGNQTLDVAGMAGIKNKKLGVNVYANRYSSAGYDFSPETIGNTVSPFQNITLQPRLSYQFSERTRLAVSSRFFSENQENAFGVTENAQVRLVEGPGKVQDVSYNSTLSHTVNSYLKIHARLYHTRYHTSTSLNYQPENQVYDQTFFRQNFTRPELLTEWTLSEKNLLTLGTGHIAEAVEATRYEQKQTFQTNYLFFQYEWFPTRSVHVIAGGRYDAHSAYRNQFSPKLSASWQVTEKFMLRGSAGVGFKAPDFRQLYLNFNNAVAGYSVFGALELAPNLERMQAAEQILDVLLDPSTFGALRPESSRAFNVGFQFTPAATFKTTFNAFRNDVQDLIETQAVARKTNGQSVFSYLNISEVFTQGAELESSNRWEFGKSTLTLSVGYQYLEAKDKAVVRRLNAGNVFRRDPETLVTERVPKASYGGLMGRSKHSANARLFYTGPNGISASLRGIYRGRYGFGDRNSNDILDADNEYVTGYMVWNVAAGRHWKQFSVQAGVDNLFNFTNAAYIPAQPGRLGWLRISASLEKKRASELN